MLPFFPPLAQGSLDEQSPRAGSAVLPPPESHFKSNFWFPLPQEKDKRRQGFWAA